MRQHQQHTAGDDRIRFDVAVEMPAPPEVVFAYLSHLENNPQWNWSVTATTPLDDRRGRGARYLQEYAWPRPGHDILEVTAYHPPRLLEVVAKERPEGAVSYRYHLAPMDTSSTRLEVSVELEPTYPTTRPDMYAARVSAAIATNLHDLSAVIEARNPTPSPLAR